MPLAMPPAAQSPIPQAMYAPPAIDFTHSFRGSAPATPIPQAAASETNSPASGEKRSASPSFQDSLRKKQSLDLSIHSLLNATSSVPPDDDTRQKLKEFLDIQIPNELNTPEQIREYLKARQKEISDRLKDMP